MKTFGDTVITVQKFPPKMFPSRITNILEPISLQHPTQRVATNENILLYFTRKSERSNSKLNFKHHLKKAGDK